MINWLKRKQFENYKVIIVLFLGVLVLSLPLMIISYSDGQRFGEWTTVLKWHDATEFCKTLGYEKAFGPPSFDLELLNEEIKRDEPLIWEVDHTKLFLLCETGELGSDDWIGEEIFFRVEPRYYRGLYEWVVEGNEGK